ncbi:hypothetical protein GC163_14185 [bacterium]|nr:hypothetical protein [bacterium]
MPLERLILSSVIGGTALLLMGLARPLIRRRIRPNRYYGFCTPATLRDESLWYDVNAQTGTDLYRVGTGTLLLTAIYLIDIISLSTFTLITAGWMTLGSLWSALHGFVIIHRSAKRDG